MYEKAAFCSPEEYSCVARYSVPLKFDSELSFLQEFYSQISLAWRIVAIISLPFKLKSCYCVDMVSYYVIMKSDV